MDTGTVKITCSIKPWIYGRLSKTEVTITRPLGDLDITFVVDFCVYSFRRHKILSALQFHYYWVT